MTIKRSITNPRGPGRIFLQIIIFPVACIALLLFVPFVLYEQFRAWMSGEQTEQPGLSPLDATPDLPVDFVLHHNNWLAIRCTDIQAVVSAMQLNEVTPANWASGLQRAEQCDYNAKEKATNYYVFVSPPVNGWILVSSLGLPSPSSPLDKNTPFTALHHQLIFSFPEVQCFGINDTVGVFGWSRAIHGQWQRLFLYSEGTVHTNIGVQQPEESCVLGTLDLTGLDTVTATDRFAQDETPHWQQREDETFYPIDAEAIKQLAAQWSIDPTILSQIDMAPATGLCGRLPVHFQEE